MSTPLNENAHTFGSYDFATYCAEAAEVKRKCYFSENFDLENGRTDVFGQHNECSGKCQGTGWVPVSKSDMDNPYRHLYVQAEVDTPSEDGWHLVPCQTCNPIKEELDEHIVKQGSDFVLKSKKSGKDLGSYPSKSGAEKREKQVEYFKHLKEDSVLPGDSGKKKEAKEAPEKKDDNESDQDRKEKAKQNRDAKEKERKSKKLLPYEFASQKDAEKSGGHLGLTGAHDTGNGIYKPGSSDYSLRDAVARKKEKQNSKGHRFQEDVTAVKDMETANLHEIWQEAVDQIKAAVKRAQAK